MTSAQKKQSTNLHQALIAFKGGDIDVARDVLATFIAQKFNLDINELAIRQDTLSLNSINGTFSTEEGEKFFFKFHMEESEETVAEYYRAELLDRAGYPVETPLYLSKEPGEQILIYPYKNSERLADMCRRLEQPEEQGSIEYNELLKAQAALDKISAEKTLETLHTATSKELKDEPLLQLFYWRLVDVAEDGSIRPGGRYHRFYVGQDFSFPDNVTMSYEDLSRLTWNINGIEYPVTLDQCFTEARTLLAPDHYASYAACTAHGDAHNGNVWANKDKDGHIDLSWFDPAFAGEHIPVLLAEVKTLFHNIFAHADWLYDAGQADQDLSVSCDVKDGMMYVEHNWELPALRRDFLYSKLENFWKPVLGVLKAQDQLPDDWEAYVRCALFCCPTLVMNLRAGAGSAQNKHTPRTSLLGLSIAIMLSSAPAEGEDALSQFFKELRDSL